MLSLYLSLLQKNRIRDFKNNYFVHIMVIKKLVPLAGLPNQGSGKKLQKRHWLSTRKKLPNMCYSCELSGATEGIWMMQV